MGLIGFVLDGVFLSAGAAAIRRTTGFSARDKVVGMIQHPGARMGVSAYFEMGEWCADKSLLFYNRSLKKFEESEKQQHIGKKKD
mmetsp:Transcript_7123/g.10764  ORF Transcript_7123/g.10764 Transcript_7123/m.10764 type:complete len:85 (-) Transcript_7123:61-315(-)